MNKVIFCKAIEAKLKRKLTIDEIYTVKDYIANIRLDRLMSVQLAFKYHLEKVIRLLSRNEEPLDLKEYQVATIGVNDETGYSGNAHLPPSQDAESAKLEAMFLIEAEGVYDLAKALAPKSRLRYNYLLLDSDNCIEINDSRDKFTWLINQNNVRLQTGYINLHSKMKNVVMARLGRMTMAHMHKDFTDAAVARHRFGFGFEEFASQALITPENTRFQFIEFLQTYDRNYGTTFVLSSFNSNRGWFRFREPFNNLDKLTLTITDLFDNQKMVVPVEPFSLAATHLINTIAAWDGDLIPYPITIPGEPLYLPYDYNYGINGPQLNTETDVHGDYIFQGYNSGFPLIDAAWNTGTHAMLSKVPLTQIFVPIPALPRPVIPMVLGIDFTIILTHTPRFTGVLELISEVEQDE